MDLERLKKEAKKEAFLIRDGFDLERWRIKYLGRKSALSLFFNSLSKLSLAKKREQGKEANAVRHFFASLYKQKKEDLENNSFFPLPLIDITRPGEKIHQGYLHPLTLTLRKIIDSFQKMGFSIIEGPEIETEYYNFDALNISANHPAREMWDTFWLKSKVKPSSRAQVEGSQKSKMLLRTHTSPMQIRYMETHQPPFRIIVPGRCFRYEATDPSHEIQFHQVEGLMVGKNISLANFKAVIEEVVKDIFKQRVLVRFRPSYFPFVAPGVEVDIKIRSKIENKSTNEKSTNEKRLKIKENEWLEIMGAGMVHPDLFRRVGYKNNCWQGFAFGLGVERITMIKYGIDDIRLFFGSDIRFLEQF